MKRLIKKCFAIIIGLVLMVSVFASVLNAAANANPSWTVDDPVIMHRQCVPYDYYGAKDPTIVYYNGQYLVYYTGANQSGGWQMCFTSAPTIPELKNAKRTFMSKISESYFCAPELFYFEPQKLWYLVYQDGTHGAAYSTSTNPADPNSWVGPKSFGISGNMGWDYFVICDDQYAYMYNTPSAGGGVVYMRKTALANFPNKGWSSSTVSVSNVFEGAEVYKSLADNQYYLLIEAMINGRSYELFTSPNAGGPWTLVNKTWASSTNLKTYRGSKWTTNVSHGELIRSGYNQKLEIKDINHVDFLIQGTLNLNGEYQQLIWDLGLIRNYSGAQDTSTSTTPTNTPTKAPTNTPTITPTTTSNIIYGDVNGDKVVDSADYTLLRQYLIRKITSFPDSKGIQAADVNLDKAIDSADFTYLRKFLLRIITSLPVGGASPTTTPSAGKSLLDNADFETGNIQSWSSMGAVTLETDKTQVHGGSYSLKVSDRTDTWNGAAQSVLNKFENGCQYNISAWVKLDNAASDTVKVTLMSNVDGTASYSNLATGSATNTEWVELKGTYTHNISEQPTELLLYVEGPASGVNFYVDNVSITSTVKVTPTPTPTQNATSKFHCFLLLGQSNMAGYSKAEAADKVEDSRVLVLGYDNNSALGRVTDQWDIACPPLHDAWNGAVGPGDWFGKAMIQKVKSGDTIGLVPCAISGEKIETFMKSEDTKYNWIINRAKLAQQKGGIIDGIIFHQGESNSGQSDWPNKVNTLVTDLRKDLNLGDVPFIAGELLYSGPCAGHNTQVNKLPSLIKNCYVVSASGLVVNSSDTAYRLHFDHDSTVTLGKRYAEKMIEVLGW